MAKAILVMDRPETCEGCDIVMAIPQGETLEHFCPKLMCPVNPYYRPINCPLIPAIGYVEPVGNMVSWEDET